MSKELKIGIIALIALGGAIWGYQFVKGKNILGKTQSYYTVYDNVEGLKMSAPVEINGYVVGAVSKIEINEDNAQSMKVSFDISGDWRIPKSTKALLAADNSLVGSKKIILDFSENCTQDCLSSGYLEPGTRGMLEAMLGSEDVDGYVRTLKTEVGPIVDTIMERLTATEKDTRLSHSMANLETTIANLASLTKSMDHVMRNSSGHLNNTMANVSTVTDVLADTNQDLEKTIKNVAQLTEDLAASELDSTLLKTGATVDMTNALLADLKTTAQQSNETFESLNKMLADIEGGNGAIGKLMTDSTIYDNLEATTEHLSLLLQDLRLNPKRYVGLSIFGRKGAPYTYPKDDPALIEIKREKEKEARENK